MLRTLHTKIRISYLPRRHLSGDAVAAAATDNSKRITVKEVESGIFHVEFNRPEKMNALDLKTFQEISAMALSLKANKSVRAVIISGKGKAFCTGLDVKGMVSELSASSKLLEKPAAFKHSNMAQDVAYLWRALPVPVIACLHGMVYGGGLQIALGADFRFATPDCKLSIMEAKWGIIPDMSAAVTLRELVRIDVAKELTMTGRIFSATEGQGYGLITRYISCVSC
jgi:enoyl-CoA hydratase/carnithine racemase